MCRWSLQNIQRENCWEGFKFPPGAYSCRVRIVVKILNVPEYFRHRMLVASDFVSFLRSFARHGILIFLIRIIPKILSDEFVLEIFWSVLLDRLCICYNILIDSEIGRNYIRLRVKFLLHNIIKNHGTGFAKFNWESDWKMICADAHIYPIRCSLFKTWHFPFLGWAMG